MDLLKVKLLVLFTLLAAVAVAQENPKKRSLEIFVGPSLVYNHSSEQFEEYGRAKLAYHFGLNVRHPINGNFHVSTSIGFYRKGFKQSQIVLRPPDIYNSPPTNDLPPEEVELKSNLNNDYLIVHVLPEYSIVNNRLSVAAGVYCGRLINSKRTTEDILEGNVVRKRISENMDSFEEFDYGLSFLAGYKFQILNSNEIQLSFSMDYGLISYQITDIVGFLPRKNLSYNLRLSYKLF